MKKTLIFLLSFFFFASEISAQNRTITGVVTDETGSGIANASVLVKGTTLGTATGTDGTFSISIPSSAKTLVFSAVGFNTLEMAIGKSNAYSVQLKSVENTMEEVVVVAYGTQQRTNVTGSIATIKSDQIEDKPFSSLDKALQGQVAGLISTSVSGQPGSATNVRIRGIGSMNASSAPLWVIDGVIATTGDLTLNTTTANALSSLNPDDIESISVLKDAASASIYGSRAANGVILVTTKKGRAGKTRFNVSAELGQNRMAGFNDNNRSLTTSENQELLRDALINAGFANDQAEADDIITDPVDGFGLKPGVETNWMDLVTRHGNQQQYNLNLSGGNEKTTFYASAGRFIQEGTVIASKFGRYNGNFSLTHKATDRLTFTTGISGSTSQQYTPANGGAFANPVLASYFLLPWYTPYNADGSLKYGDDENEFPVDGGVFNPLIQAAWNKEKSMQTTFRGNVSGEYKILNNLKFTSRFAAEYLNVQEDEYRNPFYGDGQAQGGDGFASYRKIFDWTWSNFADFRQSLNKSADIYLNLKVGYEAQYYNQYTLQAGGQGFPQTLDLIYLTSAATPTTASTVASDQAGNSLFSDVAINYKDKYVLTGSFRRDGSSVFGAKHRWGNFYSVGGTWNVNQEDFMQNLSVLNLLKLRASYGENGNSNGFGFFQSLATYAFGYNYTGLPGSAPNNVGNDELTWEKNKVFNIGLDFGLWQSRLFGTIEYYDRRTGSLIANIPLSRTSGFTSQTQNIGAVSNKGIEVTIGGRPISVRGFNWDISANFAHNKNRVTELFGDRPVPTDFFNYTVGHDLQEFYLREWAGVDPANGDPLWYTDDTHGSTTNKYNVAKTSLTGKSAAPKYFGAVTNNFFYKGINLEVQFVYNFGNYIYDTWDRYLNSDGLFYGSFNQLSRQLTRWQKPGDITDVPKIIYGGNQNSYNHSSRYLYKGDYIRLRDIQLGYTIPKDIAGKLHLNNLFVYVRGTNLWTFDKDKWLPFDPEAGINSTTNFDVFISKTVTAGIKVGL